MKYIFQILSDIHLEFLISFDPSKLFNKFSVNSTNQIDPTNSIDSINPTNSTIEVNLILAGDIGNPFMSNYEEFLILCTQYYDNIFIIAGNHEFYNLNNQVHTMDQVINQIKNICSNINVTLDNSGKIYFLNNTVIKHKNIFILGTTLWSYVDSNSKKYSEFINDYNYINEFSIRQNNQLFDNNKIWLQETLNNIKLLTDQTNQTNQTDQTDHIDQTNQTNSIKCIVITHHMPSFALVHKKFKSKLYSHMNAYFASDLDYLITKPVNYWIYGHTHTQSRQLLNEIEMCCNPLGYSDEKSLYKSKYLIEIDTN